MRLFTRTASTAPGTLSEQLADRAVHILDVRQPAEWRHGHICGSHNVPLKAGLPIERTTRR